MKVVQINATCGVGSTGKICVGISELLDKNNIENYILYSSRTNGDPHGVSCSNDRYIKWQALKSRLFGNYGFNSRKATKRMIFELERVKPDIVHLHNIHGHDANLEMLFSYFREKKTKLIWTFHDCWSFTGYCTYFDLVKCGKWKTGCEACPQRCAYSRFFDKSRTLYKKKKALFEGLDLTVVTPSEWLAGVTRRSFFGDYPIEVICNGIDISVFRPTPSNFRQKYGLENKKMVLGVSAEWGERKGLDVFLTLSKRLPPDYKIVLVGTDDIVDRQLPEGVISIHRTQDQKELAEIYSAADVFVNPTREEVFGLVNVEALACGTPGITFQSGGSPECYDETCGSVIDCNDIDALTREIIRACSEKPYTREACINKSKQFDKEIRFMEYLALYERVDA